MEPATRDMLATPVTEIGAPDVLRIPTAFVNVYALGTPGGPWILLDTGLPGFGSYVASITDARFGRPPEAIVLTHGHFDHAGNARELAERWNVPVYAHGSERPFLNGTSDYPPGDPSMGGAIAHFSRAFPHAGRDLGTRLRELAADGALPGIEDWRWLHTPGHTPGHVSLWRQSDRFLIAGDALATFDLDSWSAQLTHSRQISRPAAPFTPDWDAAHESLQKLAGLKPHHLAAGHGRIMHHYDVADRLDAYAQTDHRPEYGRYVNRPAEFDGERGLVTLPAPVEDRSLPALVAGIAVVALGGVALTMLLRSSDGSVNRRVPRGRAVVPVEGRY